MFERVEVRRLDDASGPRGSPVNGEHYSREGEQHHEVAALESPVLFGRVVTTAAGTPAAVPRSNAVPTSNAAPTNATTIQRRFTMPSL